jgi:hypothetical protein
MLRSIALFGTLAPFALFAACSGRADAIGGTSQPESSPPPDASSPQTDASSPSEPFDATPGVPDAAKPDTGPVPVPCTACQQIAQGPVNSMVANDTGVYWLSIGPSATPDIGTLMKESADGGAPVTLASSQGGGAGIAVDATNVYWTNQGPCAVVDGGTDVVCNSSVRKIPIAGGTPTTLATDTAQVFGIAVDATNVYWSDQDNRIMGTPIQGGASFLVTATSALPFYLGISGENLYWTALIDCDASVCTQAVMRVAVPGGATSIFASGRGSLAGVDATNAYLVDPTSTPGSFTVRRAPLNGDPMTTLGVVAGTPYGVTVDATSIYWTDSTAGTVSSVPFGGNTPTVLAGGQTSPGLLAVTSSSLYWVEEPTYTSVPTPIETFAGALIRLTPK